MYYLLYHRKEKINSISKLFSEIFKIVKNFFKSILYIVYKRYIMCMLVKVKNFEVFKNSEANKMFTSQGVAIFFLVSIVYMCLFEQEN